ERDEARAVMLLDAFDDHPGKLVKPGEAKTFLDVRDDDLCTERRREVVVGILAGLVLGEIGGPDQLADVVERSLGPTEDRIRADRSRCRFSQVRRAERMHMRAWRAQAQLFEQGVLWRAELEQRPVTDKAEHAFEQRNP